MTDVHCPVTRDGPGWRAEGDLPYGVTATDVIERRDKLASGLRRKLGCVWPEPVPDEHTGLDRELSAGAKPLRDSYRAQHRAHHFLLPPPGVGGTAIDQRLRLAFTAAASVDDASLIGIDLSGGIGSCRAGLRMRAAGNELAVRRLDLDNRNQPIDHGQDEEEELARMLIAAAWYQVFARTPIGPNSHDD